MRNQSDEIKFFKKVVAMMLRPDELARIRSKASYSDELEDWTVPSFIFKQKDLVFPKLNGQALVNDAFEQRDVKMLDGASVDIASTSDKKSKGHEPDLRSDRHLGGKE